MTIIGLFRRYRRWNPVHPTYGAFWGLGIGLGCGVGWGPGFGPESVGFVGGGCGVGFSVGVTFIGFGIGLPASGLTCLPYNAMTWASCEVFDFAKFATPFIASATKQGLDSLAVHASVIDKRFHKEVTNLQQVKWDRLPGQVEAAVKQSWEAIGKNVSDCERNLCRPKLRALQPLKMEYDKGITSDARTSRPKKFMDEGKKS